MDCGEVSRIARSIKPGGVVDCESTLSHPANQDRLRVIVWSRDPLPAGVSLGGIASTAARFIGGIVASEVIERATEPVSGYAEYVTRTKTWEFVRGAAIDAFLDAVAAQIHADALSDEAAANYSVQTLQQIMDRVMYATIILSALVSEDAGELAMEAFQEAFSNAVMAGIGGQISLVANYRAGFIPPPGPLDNDSAAAAHPRTRALIDAFSGLHRHYLVAVEAGRLAQRMDDAADGMEYAHRMLESAQAAYDPQGYLLAHYAEELRNSFSEVISLLRQEIAVLIRRVNDIEVEARSVEADRLNALLDDAQALTVYTSLLSELDSIEQAYNGILGDAQSIVVEQAQAIADTIYSAAIALIDVLRDYANTVLLDEFNKYTDTLNNARVHQPTTVEYNIAVE